MQHQNIWRLVNRWRDGTKGTVSSFPYFTTDWKKLKEEQLKETKRLMALGYTASHVLVSIEGHTLLCETEKDGTINGDKQETNSQQYPTMGIENYIVFYSDCKALEKGFHIGWVGEHHRCSRFGPYETEEEAQKSLDKLIEEKKNIYG